MEITGGAGGCSGLWGGREGSFLWVNLIFPCCFQVIIHGFPEQKAHLSRDGGFDVSNQAFFDKQTLIPIARTVDVIPTVPVPVVAPGG